MVHPTSSSNASLDVPVRTYDVFLNHRGPDVKKTLISHLHVALKKVNFSPFLDCLDLETGDQAWQTLKSAIQHSKIHVAVFSPLYAESRWCLEELNLIMKCYRDKTTDLFLPVFFHVEPSDLRLLMPGEKMTSGEKIRHYDPAIVKHANTYDAITIENWKKSLNEASMVKGYNFPAEFDGIEARLVEKIVSNIIKVLSRATILHGPELPVGVDEKLQEALDLMKREKETSGRVVQKLGIYGMGGLGKTTLAKSIYNRIHREFESACFVQSVREGAQNAHKGLVGLQKEMLNELLKTSEIPVPSIAQGKQMMLERLEGKKVLIILDDVNEKEQLDVLMPPRNCHLGEDSQIMITTRDEQVLMFAQVNATLLMKGLSRPLACRLFNLHAFDLPEAPSGDLKKLAERVADACQGLPLALEVLGAHLRRKDVSEWEATVEVLETGTQLLDPQRQVTAKLRISFDALGSQAEKEMFLDIACILFEEPKDKGERIWGSEYGDACTKLHLKNLLRKCLVMLDKNGNLTMHDLLRDMGREIVDKSHPTSWGRSHLWRESDVHGVLRRNKGTSHVRGLRSNGVKEWETTSFAGMDELKLLVLSNVNLKGDLSKIPQELTWFQLRNCPRRFPLPLNEIGLDKVAVLDLEGSKLTSLTCAGCTLQNLKEVNLSSCSELQEIPVEFCKSSNSLEILRLSGCVNLKRMPDSISELSSSLTYLDISSCTQLGTLPNGIANLSSLTTLLMNNCRQLTKLPDAIGQLTALEKIGLDGVPLSKLPQSFSLLRNLISLRLDNCNKLKELPSTIDELRKLTSLEIISCPLISKIPSVGKLLVLKCLRVSDCLSVSELPEGIGNLRCLVELHVCDIVNLISLPDIRRLYYLEVLNLQGCYNLCEVQCLPSSLTSLDVAGCTNLKYFDIRYGAKLKTFPNIIESLQSLEEMHLHRLSLVTLPQSFTGGLSNLVSFHLSHCPELRELPSTLGKLEKLTSLVIESCGFISEIPQGVTNLTNLVRFRVSDCRSLKQMPEDIWDLWNLLKEFHVSAISTDAKLSVSCISQLEKLESLVLEGCNLADGLPSIGYSALSSLKRISLAGSSISSLPRGFGDLPNLENLILQGCPNLSEVPCLPASLTSLNMGGCSNLKRIYLLSLTKLTSLELFDCTQLEELNGLECLCLLSELDITGCRSLLDLPSDQIVDKLTSLRILRLAGSGVSILQDRENPWIHKMVSLEVVSITADKLPDYVKKSQLKYTVGLSREFSNSTDNIASVPQGNIACSGVLFCFVAKEYFVDMHHTDTVRSRKHEANFTMNVLVRLKKGKARPKFRQSLFYKWNLNWTEQLHICIFRASHPFVASLKGGDEICLNIVRSVTYQQSRVDIKCSGVVKLMYGENEMQETLQNLSLINKSWPHDRLWTIEYILRKDYDCIY